MYFLDSGLRRSDDFYQVIIRHTRRGHTGSSHEIRLHRISLMQDFLIADSIIIPT
jgi:hypothetical protein